MDQTSVIILVLLIVLLYLYYKPNRYNNDHINCYGEPENTENFLGMPGSTYAQDFGREAFRGVRRSLDPDTLFEGFVASYINRDAELNKELGFKGDPYYVKAPKKVMIAEATGFNMQWKYLSVKYDPSVKVTMYSDNPAITLRVRLDVDKTAVPDLKTFAEQKGFSNNGNLWLELI